MKKTSLILITLLCALACSDPGVDPQKATSDVKVIDGRLVFSSEEALIAAFEKLQSGDVVETANWERGHTFNSLKTALENDIDNGDLTRSYGEYPLSHQIILNSDGIVQAGEEVILYYGEAKYYLPVAKFNAIKATRDMIPLAERKGVYKIVRIENGYAENARQISADLAGNVGTGGDQFQFTLGDGSERKYITEPVSTYETFGGQLGCSPYYDTRLTLYLRLKLEGRVNSRRSWSACPDVRTVSWNVSTPSMSCYAYPPCSPFAASIPVTTYYSSGSTSNATSNIWVPLASSRQWLEYETSTYSGYWAGSISGTTYQSQNNVSVPHTVYF
ncbi:hypothetical protein KK083_12180 [Fulvivirgaceae bacterium PWU4]|uniref:Uncharacterized protein n=1 Tax=Chryseosolibacter histidini TaxID=2782349 RepID=A0AAP2DJU4_9BACT|nr:hypothetical protein [Chryseosolibacter histidini]MBT1697640.1 hypothetical protein [Chryseosolibacter histidini]